MSFPLRRLPYLAINEVIQSMDTRSIFEFSLVSKKSQNLVMLSIPASSLSTYFTFRKNGFLFELMPKGFMKQTAFILPVTRRGTEDRPVFTRFSTCGLYVQCELAGTSEVEEFTRKLFYRFSKTFKNSKLSITFQYQTREEFAMEMMRFAWENGFPLERIEFDSRNSSSESIQELLNRCNGEHTSLHIGTELPEGFKYTPPPGGYKFESLVVQYARWVNLDDFLQCRKVYLLNFLPDLTPKYLNGLLKKIVNMECGLEHFALNLWKKPSDFAPIVSGLSESEIQQNGLQELQFERKDGLKLLVRLSCGCLILEDACL
ncbi:hypothetical protein CAEBREN_07601 [Caenorhabditis brenneri]|uniref:F-box domain-containing protein n=1 Tax=Caenorhabditis brenneri TaxID=135651 RepID=G0MII4_CAEBE|nr:hypothetical protein CAEBREN_07601 [Caenorhabditis brenneri]